MLFRFSKKNPDRCPYWDICDCNPYVRKMASTGRWRGAVHVHMSPDIKFTPGSYDED